MKTLFLAPFLLSLLANTSFAAEASCEAKAVEKKIFGAAKNSFTKKCIADAGQ